MDGFRLLTEPRARSFERIVFIVFLECEIEDEADFSDACEEAGGSKEPGWLLRFGIRNGLGRILDFLHDRRSEVRGRAGLSRCNPEVEFVIR